MSNEKRLWKNIEIKEKTKYAVKVRKFECIKLNIIKGVIYGKGKKMFEDFVF